MPTIRRTLKNVVKNYSDAQVKVREATSNDPWGPSSTLMSEVADLTFNVVAFTEIMQMIWKRLNDDGKHWRHVYKSLVLLDYIIKTGSEKVAQQCKENFHAIKTLTSFQHIDVDNKDQGMNVREKAKQLVSLLSDDERLKNERAKALKAKERFAQNAMGVGSSGPGPVPSGRLRMDRASPTMQSSSGGYSDPYGGAMAGYNDSSPGSGSGGTSSEMENARPSSAGEEELQLQLALAMSKEEHDEEVRRIKSDEMKLQMALEQSRKTVVDESQPKESLLDLSNTSMNASAGTTDPWGMPLGAQQAPPKDPWGATLPAPQQVSDAWGPQGGAPAAARTTPLSQPPAAGTDAWGMSLSSPSGTSPPGYMAGSQNDPWLGSQMPQGGGGSAFGNGTGSDTFGAPATNGTNGASTVDNEFDLLSSRSNETSPSKSAGGKGGDEFDLLGGGGGSSSSGGGAWDLSGMQQGLPDPSRKKSPEDFLGANANLVNLDQLVAKAPPKVSGNTGGSTLGLDLEGNNPFAMTAPGSSNPFQDGSNSRVAMAQMSPVTPGFSQPAQSGLLPAPLMPLNSPQQPLQPQNNAYNPFL
ncbi:epsin-2-like isoform X2 [Babylonia areolata]|uniref:epsin-2-like isoform X2 n=1 Tax=Babylonia areolata TaxID=304850 RepID=UPI003FCFC075